MNNNEYNEKYRNDYNINKINKSKKESRAQERDSFYLQRQDIFLKLPTNFNFLFFHISLRNIEIFLKPQNTHVLF